MSIDEKTLDSEQKSNSHNKAKSYFGLLIALSFLIVMNWQFDFRQLGKSGGFFQKTLINALVWSEGRGIFVINYEKFLDDCNYAQKSAYTAENLESKNTIRNIFEVCSRHLLVNFSNDSFNRIQAFDPEYKANRDEYKKLLKKAEQEKTDIHNNPNAIDIAEKISISLHKDYSNAQTWLNWMNVIAHFFVLLLSIMGLRYRRGLGNLALAPFRWITSAGKGGIKVAKDIHEKI